MKLFTCSGYFKKAQNTFTSLQNFLNNLHIIQKCFSNSWWVALPLPIFWTYMHQDGSKSFATVIIAQSIKWKMWLCCSSPAARGIVQLHLHCPYPTAAEPQQMSVKFARIHVTRIFYDSKENMIFKGDKARAFDSTIGSDILFLFVNFWPIFGQWNSTSVTVLWLN